MTTIPPTDPLERALYAAGIEATPEEMTAIRAMAWHYGIDHTIMAIKGPRLELKEIPDDDDAAA